MIVVPPFAGGDEGDPPVIPGIIMGSESTAAPHVRDRVDQPGRVVPDYDSKADAPKHAWNTADGEKE